MLRRVTSGIIVAFLLTSMLTLALNIQTVEGSGTIYIRADGSIDPPTGPIQSDYSITSMPPAVEWNKTYGGSDRDKAYSLVQTSDGGYAIAGETLSFGAGGKDFWLVKTDVYGNMQWNRTYGQISYEGANSVVQTSDGGYALAGWYDSETHGDQFRLIKTDSLGNTEWNQTLGDYGYDIANCVIETSDGGLAVAGATSKFGYYDGYYYSDSWLVKFDFAGNIEWEKTYGYAAPKSDIARSVVQTSDGGYALAMQADYSDLLVKTDADGNMQWNKTIEKIPYGSVAYSVIQTVDEGYAIVGVSYTSYGDTDCRLVKTDSFGEIEWDRSYSAGPWYNDYAHSVVQLSDGGYAIAGSSGYRQFFLIRIDTTGEAIYYGEYGPYYSHAYSVVKTNDGGYAMAGTTYSSGSSDDFYLVKIAPELLQHDVAIVEVWPWVTIVYQGSWVPIDVTVANLGDCMETFNVTLYANTTIIETKEVTLASVNSINIIFTWNTTNFAKGNYTISAYAWPVPGETDTADNTYIDGWVLVTIPGDVDGDRDVDIFDIVAMIGSYGSEIGDPEYESNYDIDDDGDIDIFDIVIACNHYGESW